MSEIIEENLQDLDEHANVTVERGHDIRQSDLNLSGNEQLSMSRTTPEKFDDDGHLITYDDIDAESVPSRKSRRLAGKRKINFAALANLDFGDQAEAADSFDIRAEPESKQLKTKPIKRKSMQSIDPLIEPYENDIYYKVRINDEYTCPLCQTGFDEKDELKAHAVTHVTKVTDEVYVDSMGVVKVNDFYKCLFCQFVQRCKKFLLSHIALHFNKKDGWRCRKCNFCLFSPGAVKFHEGGQVHRSGGNFMLELDNAEANSAPQPCGPNYGVSTAEYGNPIALRIHPRIDPKDEWPCLVCGQQLPPDPVENYLHYFYHIERLSVVDDSGRTFEEAIFICPLCRLHLYKKDKPHNIDWHLKAHFDIRPFMCTVCDKSFFTGANARDHLATDIHRRRAIEKGIKEDHRSFELIHVVDSMRIPKDRLPSWGATGWKRGRPKTMMNIRNFQDVEQVPSDIKQIPQEDEFSCIICEDEIVTKNVEGIVDHYYSHSQYLGEVVVDGNVVSLYGCPLCGYKSRYRFNIRNHVRHHLNMRPFDCKFCDRQMPTKAAFKLHCATKSHLSSLAALDVDPKVFMMEQLGKAADSEEVEAEEIRHVMNYLKNKERAAQSQSLDGESSNVIAAMDNEEMSFRQLEQSLAIQRSDSSAQIQHLHDQETADHLQTPGTMGQLQQSYIDMDAMFSEGATGISLIPQNPMLQLHLPNIDDATIDSRPSNQMIVLQDAHDKHLPVVHTADADPADSMQLQLHNLHYDADTAAAVSSIHYEALSPHNAMSGDNAKAERMYQTDTDSELLPTMSQPADDSLLGMPARYQKRTEVSTPKKVAATTAPPVNQPILLRVGETSSWQPVKKQVTSVDVSTSTDEPIMENYVRLLAPSADSLHWRRRKAAIKPFECPICSKRATYFKSLLEHICLEHTRIESNAISSSGREFEIISCPMCTFKATLRPVYKTHIKAHIETMRPYVCMVCDFECYDKMKFTRHFLDARHQSAAKLASSSQLC